jgi:tetratricopeptide (TPR) repeat protein
MVDTTYIIDDNTLRDRPADESAARARVAELEEIGPDGDGERVSLLRMLGELDRAEALGWQVMEREGGPGSRDALTVTGVLPVDAVASAIRLAHVLHWKEDFDAADDLFSAALRSLDNARMNADDRVPGLEAFTHQHLGKMRFDQGKIAIAQLHFEQALKIREEEDVPEDQLESSRQALRVTRSILSNG